MTELSRMLVREESDENSTVYIDASPKGDSLVYRVQKNRRFVDAATGHWAEI